MSFQIRVQRVTHLKEGDLYILDGFIESGKVFVGSVGTVTTNPSRRIKITGIGSHSAADGSFSILIAPPDFPLSQLEGAIIVGE
jgi:hypothetical protein